MRAAAFGLGLFGASLLLSAGGAAQPLPELEAAEPAASEQAEPDPALESPRATVKSFLIAMNDLWVRPEAWGEATACLDLSLAGEAAGRERARQLYAVLNRIEQVVPEELPASAGDSYRFFPDRQRHRRLLAKIGPPQGAIVLTPDSSGAWRFDTETVARLPALFEQMEALPLVAGRESITVSDWLESNLPAALVDGSFLSVRYWQWFAIFLVILAGLLADGVVRTLLRSSSGRMAHKLGGNEDPEQLRKTLRPIGMTVAATVWLIPFRFVDLDETVALVLVTALRVVLVVAGTLSAWRVIDLAAGVLATRAQQTSTRMDDILVPLVTRAVKLFVLTMGAIYAADALDIPIAPLLASLTVAGVGFSFAAKDTVENFFGSISVILDRPFDIGDWVVIGETEGIVEQVGFRSTRVRTFYNSQVSVPNSNLVRAVVDNYGRRQYRRWHTTLCLQYDTTPDQLISFTEGVRELIRLHPYTRKDYYQVWCNEFGDSSLDVMLYMFFDVPDWNTELRERERLFLDILRLANRLSVEFAFPTRTLHVFPGEAAPAPAEAPASSSESASVRAGAVMANELVRAQPWRRARPGPVVFATGPSVELDDAGNPVEHEEPEEPKISS